jgi:DNA adenine methylase
MKITALCPWYGSKRTLAAEIIRQLGPHRCYWEPMCGSCSVLLGKLPVTYESVNDLHRDLINLARVVADEQKAQALYGRAARTLFHEAFCAEAKEHLRSCCDADGDVERAYWYLVFSWFHLSGIAGTPLTKTGTFCVRYSSKGGNGATRWRSVVESIPDWHERLRGVQLLCRDAFGILEEIEDSAGTALYVDPPYLEKCARYVHDFEPLDHARLSALLFRFRQNRVVLSYYDHPLLDELYPGWTKVHVCVAKSMVNSGMRDGSGRAEAPEVLLINGPAVTEQHDLF